MGEINACYLFCSNSGIGLNWMGGINVRYLLGRLGEVNAPNGLECPRIMRWFIVGMEGPHYERNA